MEFCDPRLVETAENLVKSVEVILNPSSLATSRAEAQAYYDNIRLSTGPADKCSLGFMLLSSNASPLIIHTGIQFINIAIQYHGSELSTNQRNTIKETLLRHVRENTSLLGNTAFNTPYVKESLAKAIVEIAKKEWPQLWPEFIDQMVTLSSLSNVPFLILRRLIEDVVSLDTIDLHERKTALMQSLNLTASEVTEVLFNALKNAMEMVQTTNDIQLQYRIKLILSVITSYFEFVNTSVILTERRISYILTLLRYKEFQFQALECAQQVLERKGTKKEEEIPKEFLQASCTESIVNSVAACDLSKQDDLDYLYKLGEVLAVLGSATHAGSASTQIVTNFSKCTIMLCSTGDLKAHSLAAAAFQNLLRNVKSPYPPNLASLVEELISVLLRKFLTPPNIDEKSDLIVLKQSLVQLLKGASKFNRNYYMVVRAWYYECLQSTAPVPTYQWDVLAFVLDVVASSIRYESKPGEPKTDMDDLVDELVKAGLNDLATSLSRFNTEPDQLVRSSHLSVVSSLFVFLKLVNEQEQFGDQHRCFMESIFTAVFGVFLPGEISDAQHELRKHASSLLIKLATKHPVLLSTSYNYLSNLATSASPNMRKVEVQFIMESFFVLSNTWKDYQRQKELVERVLMTDTWSEIERLVDSPESFITLFEETSIMQKKSTVMNNLHMLHACLRRIENVSVGPNGDKEHAAFEACQLILPIVFQFVKMMYSIIENPQFQGILDLSDNEKIQVLGIMQATGTVSNHRHLNGSEFDANNEAAKNDYRTTVSKFVRLTLELSYGILSWSCILFTPKIYRMPNILNLFLNSVGWKMQILPDFRIRSIVHGVYRPFLLGCPAALQETVLLPFLRAFGPFMLERLTQRWVPVQEAAYNDSEGCEEHEILEAAVLRLLTRDYLDIIYGLLEGATDKRDNSRRIDGISDTMDVEMKDEIDEPKSVTLPPFKSLALSEIGTIILRDPACFQALIHLCGIALCWDDSGVNYRAARCLIISWDVVALQIEVVLGVLMNSLLSLCTWSDNEANKDILIRLIDLIHRRFYKQDLRICQMMIDWGSSTDDLNTLASIGLEGNKNEKKRKEVIRRMLSNNPNLERNKRQKTSWLDGIPKLVLHKDNSMKENANEMHDSFALVDTLIP